MPATALRPRSATEIIDASFQILRRHYTQLVAVAVVALLPYIVIVAAFGGTGSTSPAALLAILAQYLCAALAEAAVIAGVSDAYLNGSVDIHRALVSTAGRLLTVLLAGLLRGIATLVGFLVFFFPGFYVLLRTFAIIPVVVLEEKSAGEALGRSWALAKGEVGKVFLTLLLAWLIFFVLLFLVIAIAGILAALLASIHVTQNERASSLVVAILLALIYPITGAVTTLLYYDIRVRREGFDLELLAREGAPVAPSA